MQDYTKTPKPQTPRTVARDEPSLEHPPRGVTLERTVEGDTLITIGLRRSSPMYEIFTWLLGILIWNGLTSLFVICNIENTIELFAPAARTGIRAAFFTGIVPVRSIPFLACLWLVSLPFIAVGILMVWWYFVHLFGDYIIRIGPDGGSVFKGIGPLGRTRRFSMQSVTAVRVHEYENDGYVRRILRIELNKKKIVFWFLSGKCQAWLYFVLKNLGPIFKSTNPENPKFTSPEPP